MVNNPISPPRAKRNKIKEVLLYLFFLIWNSCPDCLCFLQPGFWEVRDSVHESEFGEASSFELSVRGKLLDSQRAKGEIHYLKKSFLFNLNSAGSLRWKRLFPRVCPACLEGFSFPYNSEREGGRKEPRSETEAAASLSITPASRLLTRE